MNQIEFFESLKKIDEKLARLKSERKALIDSAYYEKLFNVEISDLKAELEKIYSSYTNREAKFNIKIMQTSLPSCITTKEQAQEYLIRHRPKILIMFYHNEISYYSKELQVDFESINKNSNSKEVLDNIVFVPDKYLPKIIFPEEFIIEQGLSINIHPSQLKDDLFTQAVLNCIKNKEKLKKTQKNREKQ